MMTFMRTTINLDDALLKDLRRLAAKRHMSLRGCVDEMLRRGLAACDDELLPSKRYSVPVFALGRAPGVDMNKALAFAATLEDAATMHKMDLRK